MAVYFVYRCRYGAPGEKHLRRFEYDTVLAWAQAVFRQFPDGDSGWKYADDLLGGLRVFSFGQMFVADEGRPPRECPRTMEEVGAWFNDMYDQGQANGPHHVQILTDDNETEMAVYLFDDHYRAEHPGKADFLLLGGWELPDGDSDAAPPDLPAADAIGAAVGGEGTVYAVGLFTRDSWTLTDLPPANRIDGLRLPALTRYLLRRPDDDALEAALRETRAALRRLLDAPAGEDAGFLVAIRREPDEAVSWDAYSDWLQERDLPPAGLHLLARALRDPEFSGAGKNRKPELDRVRVSAHAAQVCKHEGRWPDEPAPWLTPGDTFAQFIFFDDRWAAAHPTLAAGILTFASRWDVLS